MRDIYYGTYQGFHCRQYVRKGKLPNLLRIPGIKNVHKFTLKDKHNIDKIFIL